MKDIDELILLECDLFTIMKLRKCNNKYVRNLIFNIIPKLIYKDNLMYFINDLAFIKDFKLLDKTIENILENPKLIEKYDFHDIPLLELIKVSDYNKNYQDLIIRLWECFISEIRIENMSIKDCLDYTSLNIFIKQLFYYSKLSLAEQCISYITCTYSGYSDYENFYYSYYYIFLYDDLFTSELIYKYIKSVPNYIDMNTFYYEIGEHIYNLTSKFSNNHNQLLDYVDKLALVAIKLNSLHLLNSIIRGVFKNRLHHKIILEIRSLINNTEDKIISNLK